jgi:hypothetical protein
LIIIFIFTMRFHLLAAAIAAVVAREEVILIQLDSEEAAPEVPTQKEFKKASYYRRVRDPNIRARYKSAMGKC